MSDNTEKSIQELAEVLAKEEPCRTIDAEMESVRTALADAGKYGLEVEMVTWALKAMKADPTISIQQAIAEGCFEWDL